MRRTIGVLATIAVTIVAPMDAAGQEQPENPFHGVRGWEYFDAPAQALWAAAPTAWWNADATAADGRQEQELNVTLHFHLIEADGFETTDPSIAGIVESLRSVFRFEGYRLFDSALVTAALETNNSSTAATRMGNPDRSYEVSAFLEGTSDPERVRVSVSLSSGAATILPNGQAMNIGEILSASVNVADGQTVILGSGRPSGAEATLILAMTAMISH